MSTDYGEKERQFLDSLQADTGRDLAAWMEAVAAQGLTQRNDIIDWLRRQGFMFSKASWLERVHNNGGRPIYEGQGASRPQRRPRQRREAPTLRVVPAPADKRAPIETPAPQSAATAADKAALDQLLAKAKAFRPLANYLLAEIGKALPDAAFAPHAGHVSIARAREFAVLAISPRELRLGLDLGERPFDKSLQAAKFTIPAARISPAITHMMILTDARQVDDTLRALIREAGARAG